MSDNAQLIFKDLPSDPLLAALLYSTPLSIILEWGLGPLELPRHRSLPLLEASPWIFRSFLGDLYDDFSLRLCVFPLARRLLLS